MPRKWDGKSVSELVISSQLGLSASPFTLYFRGDHCVRKDTHGTLQLSHGETRSRRETFQDWRVRERRTATGRRASFGLLGDLLKGVGTPGYRTEEHLRADDDLDKKEGKENIPENATNKQNQRRDELSGLDGSANSDRRTQSPMEGR